MNKTEVYRWRLDRGLKQRLKHAARTEKTSIGGLLDRIARDWLGRHRSDEDDEEVQRRLHAEAVKWMGSVRLGEGPYTRARIRAHVRAPRMDKHRRWRRDAPAGSD